MPSRGRAAAPILSRPPCELVGWSTKEGGLAPMDDVTQSTDQQFWARARRHMLGYGGDFVPFVPARAEGSFLWFYLGGPLAPG